MKSPKKPKKGSYAEFKQERAQERAQFLRQQNNALSRYLKIKDDLFPNISKLTAENYFLNYVDVIWNEIKRLRTLLEALNKNPTDEVLADKAIELLIQINEITTVAEVMKS
jgi:hypothetical protein